jgi:flagellar protein FlaG
VAREERGTLLERARKAAQQIESFVRSHGRDLEFRVDDATGVVVVRVRDARTGEVIRQIPNEAALRFAEHLASAAPDEGAASLLLDEMV